MLTYDVDIWSIRKRAGRSKPFELRYRVGQRTHSRSFKLKAQAEGRSSELLAALRDRQQFDEETGLPAAELAALSSPTVFEVASEYVLMKWPKHAAKHRAGIAEALAVALPVLVDSRRGAPSAIILRRALYLWAFRAVRTEAGELVPRPQAEKPPGDIAAALEWLSKHSLKVPDLSEPTRFRPALDAVGLLLNGKRAAENTERRKRMVLSNFMRYVVQERGLLDTNPMQRLDIAAPEVDDEIDFRYVPGPRLARQLIAAVGRQGSRGEFLSAFFGCLYYAAMRPAEAAALRERDVHLPPDSPDAVEEWGELVLGESRPEVASGWTDAGTPYEVRGLKRRARKATRPVPIPPVLVRMLRHHLATYGTAPDGRLFPAVNGGRLRSTEYTEVWQEARTMVLTPHELETPLAEDPYCNRAAGVSLWIKAGLEPAEVARRAGHSVAVLYRFYAKILKADQTEANRRIAAGLEGDE
ncbi:site-specific integrase [Streptomyces albidoflavus]|uniref:site-specific integrase n=1 Tax=Streptomyces albidoflavus TaxID=1886 RepID=UPI003D0E20B9